MPSDPQKYRVAVLKPLYDLAGRYASLEQPLQRESTPASNEYAKLVPTLTANIDEQQGFYLWGCYDHRKYWHSIYLGKAGFGKTAHLRAPIVEELKDERWFIWRHVLSEERVLKMSDQIFSGRYHKECKRAMGKAGATHIIWVPAPQVKNEEITHVEADLIEALNPKSNKMRPTPPGNVQEEATRIFGAFRRTIHISRPTAFVAALL